MQFIDVENSVISRLWDENFTKFIQLIGGRIIINKLHSQTFICSGNPKYQLMFNDTRRDEYDPFKCLFQFDDNFIFENISFLKAVANKCDIEYATWFDSPDTEYYALYFNLSLSIPKHCDLITTVIISQGLDSLESQSFYKLNNFGIILDKLKQLIKFEWMKLEFNFNPDCMNIVLSYFC